MVSCSGLIQNRAIIKPVVPGKCFVKCQILEEVKKGNDPLVAIYTGDKPDEVTLIKNFIMIEPASTEWVKKKADKNCYSSDPSDCIVWCLKEVPAKYQEFAYLADTTETRDFELRYVSLESFQESVYVWEETPCREDYIDSVMKEVQLALVENGAEDLVITGYFDDYTKKALKEYQILEGLCFGELTVETLDALNIEPEPESRVERRYK